MRDPENPADNPQDTDLGFTVSGVGLPICEPMTRSVLGILFAFWIMGFHIYEQKGSRETGIKMTGLGLGFMGVGDSSGLVGL